MFTYFVQVFEGYGQTEAVAGICATLSHESEPGRYIFYAGGNMGASLIFETVGTVLFSNQ